MKMINEIYLFCNILKKLLRKNFEVGTLPLTNELERVDF